MKLDETAFIGDVHGEAGALALLLPRATKRARRLVFLGDLVNRGPSSKDVIDLIVECIDNGEIETIVLAGNHDQAFADVLEGPEREDEFLRMGGASTIRSYVDPPFKDVFTQLRGAVPRRHKQLLTSMATEWTSDGIEARHRLGDSDSDAGVRFLVAGHTVQHDRAPRVDSASALIDTGCGTVRDGRLTAFYWPSRTWDQVEVPRA